MKYYTTDTPEQYHVVKEKFGLLYTISFNKFYVDELYALLTKYFVDGIGKILYWIDVNIVDGFINGLAKITDFIGDVLRKTQTGQVQQYVFIFFCGALLLIVFSFVYLIKSLLAGYMGGVL